MDFSTPPQKGEAGDSRLTSGDGAEE